jgi:PST family polysaccharide transporter
VTEKPVERDLLEADGAAAGLSRASMASTLPPFQAITTVAFVQALAIAVLVVRSKIVAVSLGPIGVGAVSLIDQWVALVTQICAFSLPFAAVKFLSSAHSVSAEAYASLYAAFLRVVLITSGVGTVAGVFVFALWPNILGPQLAAYGGLVLLAILAIPGTNLIALTTSALAAAGRFRQSALFSFFTAVATTALCAFGIWAGGLTGYYVGNVIAVLALAVGGMHYVRRAEEFHGHVRRISVIAELHQHPKVASFAGSLYLMSFCLPVAHLVVRYAILRSGGIEATGLLQSAMAVGLALTAVMRQPNALVLTPALNRNVPQKEKFNQAIGYLRTLSVIIAVAALPLILFPDFWLYLLYSRRFLDASPYVYLFVLAQAFQLLAGVTLALLVGFDRIGTQLVVTLSGLAVLSLCSWWMAPRWGIGGVGMAFLCEGFVVFVLSAWALWSGFRMSVFRSARGWPLGVMLLLGVIGAAIPLRNWNTPILIGTRIAVWMLLTGGGLLFLYKKEGASWKGLLGRAPS